MPSLIGGNEIEGVKALAASVRVRLPDYREEIKLLIDGGEYISGRAPV